MPDHSMDTSFNGGLNSAILRYVGAPDEDPKTNFTPSATPLLESNLHPLVPQPVVRGILYILIAHLLTSIFSRANPSQEVQM